MANSLQQALDDFKNWAGKTAGAVGSFVAANPSPASFVTKQTSPIVQNFVQSVNQAWTNPPKLPTYKPMPAIDSFVSWAKTTIPPIYNEVKRQVETYNPIPLIPQATLPGLFTRKPGAWGPLDPGSLYGSMAAQPKTREGQMATAQDLALQFMGGAQAIHGLNAATASKILGIAENASPEEISTAYRNLISKEAPRTLEDLATKYKTNAARIVNDAKELLLNRIAPAAPHVPSQLPGQVEPGPLPWEKGPVKPQPVGVTSLYHASPVEGITQLRASSDGVMGKGVYLHENPYSAREASAMQGDGNIADIGTYTVKLKTNKIFQASGSYPSPEEAAQIKKQGFDGIRTPEGEVIIFDPKNVEVRSYSKPSVPPATKAEATQRLKNLMTYQEDMKRIGYGIPGSRPIPDVYTSQKILLGELPQYYKGGIPQMASSEIRRMADRAQLASIGNQSTFQKIFSQFIGERNAAKTRGTFAGNKIRTLPADPMEIINAIENPGSVVSPQVERYIFDFRRIDNAVFAKAKNLGLDIRYLRNHISHLWEQPQDQVQQAYMAFKQRYGLSNSRSIPTYKEGIQMGLKPKFTSPAQILADSVRRLEEAKAGIEAFQKLKDNGFIVPAAVGMKTPGFLPINAQGFPRSVTRVNDELGIAGNWYAPKEIADQLNRVFSPRDYGVIGKVTGVTRGASALVQDIGLSGGLPGTPFNAFGAAQVLKEITAFRPQSVVSFIRSFSDNATRDYFAKNAGQIIKMQERNIPISSSFSISNLAGGTKEEVVSMVHNAFKGKFGEAWGNIENVWSQAMNNPTFQRFMPQLQVSLFNNIESAALRHGRTPGDAADIAAEAVHNFYGSVNTDIMAKGRGVHDPLVQNFLGTFTFAPKFRESMVNFWLNNVKAISPVSAEFNRTGISRVIPSKIGLNNPFSLPNRTNTLFIVGAILTYIGMDRLNYLFNGKHMADNPPGTEDKLLIPTSNENVIGVPFLSSIATVPRALYREGRALLQGETATAIRDAGQSYLSMLFKPFMDVANNADYFGKPIYQDNATAQEKITAQAKYIASQLLTHPYLKELTDPRNSTDPAYQRLSRAMELPFRFYTEASLATKYYFGARDKVVNGLNDQEQQAFNAIPKSDSNDPNTRILKYQIYLTYPAVFQAKQAIELETAAKTGKAIDPLYLVDYPTAQKYMRYEALPEGSQDRKAMTAAYPELVAMFDIRGKYFDENPIPGLTATQRPLASADVQAAMDRKQWTYPGVREYLDANTQWNNSQREKLGLPPLAGYSSYTKKITGKKIAIKSVKVPRLLKLRSMKTPKGLTLKSGGLPIFTKIKFKPTAMKPKMLKVRNIKLTLPKSAYAQALSSSFKRFA